MRAFAIGLVVLTISVFGLFAWFTSSVWWPDPTRMKPPMMDPPAFGPMPAAFKVTVATEQGFDLVSRGQRAAGEVNHDTGTCTDPYRAMIVLPHNGRTRVRLEVRPEPGQQVVINTVHLYLGNTRPPTQDPTYRYQCAGTPATTPATRMQLAEPRGGEMIPVEGPWPLTVPADGYEQDLEIELTGTVAVDLDVELNYTLDGETRRQPLNSPELVIEPKRTDATGHWTWCDRRWRQGEGC